MANRPVCKVCGCGTVKSMGRKPNGDQRLDTKCWSCRHRSKSPEQRRRINRKIKLRRRPWLQYRKDKCEKCGFVPEEMCQLDVDHIDGDQSNNDPSNYMTLCANCHRLKSYRQKDGLAEPEPSLEPALSAVRV